MDEIEALKRQIEAHNHAYHTLDAPQITDAEYDALKMRYDALCAEKGTESTLTVGAPIASGFKEVRHNTPMLSLANAFSEDDFAKFHDRVVSRLAALDDTNSDSGALDWVSELKIDGLSLSLVYVSGQLVQAATRGDGITGEDVTQNALRIPAIPKQLTAPYPERIEVRGECYMTKQGFIALNAERERDGKKLFATPRNAAAGSLRQHNPDITEQRPLDFFAYAIAHISDAEPKTQEGALALLKCLGLPINNLSEVLSLAEARAAFDDYNMMRADLPYDIDGVVFKANSLSYQSVLGSTGRTPNWAVAWKFPAEQAVSTLEGIEIQVGRTGALTPVAHIKPVNIGGVMVSRASLHNSDEITRLDVRVGDRITVQRAGDVIPQVVSVVTSDAPERSAPYAFPQSCPSCGSEVHKDGAVHRCLNPECKAQKIERLIYFASRDVMDIEGFGEAVIKELYEDGLLTTLPSLFALRSYRYTIENKPNFGPSSVEKLLASLEACRVKETPLARFIGSLGIRHVGTGTAKLLADFYGSADDFITAMHSARKGGAEAAALQGIDGIGSVTAASLMQFFDTPHLLHEAEDLADLLKIAHTAPIKNGALSGMTVVFTGTLPTLKRADAKELAEKAGAKVSGSVSKKTDIVVIGAEPGEKADKAHALGIRTLDEAQFIREYLS